MKKIVCVLLLCAVLTGAYSIPIMGMEGTVYSSPVAVPSTSVEPLPSGNGPTLQQPLAQLPAWHYLDLSFVKARQFFVYDTRTDTYWHISGDPSTTVYPASTTKLFTTYVALQYLSKDTMLTAGKELNFVMWDAAKIGFQIGDRVRVEALVYAALLPSACDASYILAAAAGKVILQNSKATAKAAIDAFMAECNRRAKEMGMENCNLVTPDGYHEDNHKLSLQAMAIIGTACLSDSTIASVVASPTATITYRTTDGQSCSKDLKNTNHTVRNESDYYHPNSVGLKTGFTDDAGYCLLTAYEVEGGYILVGIFGCHDADARFRFANKLFEAFLPYI